MARDCLDFNVSPYKGRMRDRVLQAYMDDLGQGDVASSAVIKPMPITAVIKAEEGGMLAGVLEARFLLEKLGIRASELAKEGERIRKGQAILEMKGDARKILGAERTILNFLTRLSGIATLTWKMSKMTKAKLAATRKTCLSISDKRAVRLGGGATHRLGLFDMILIKDNHIDIVASELGCPRIGAIKECLKRAKAESKGKKIEIEVKSAKEALAAAAGKPGIIMLDKVKLPEIRKIARLLKGTGILIEASGGINERNISAFGSSGVDYISLGALTNACKPLDMSLEVVK